MNGDALREFDESRKPQPETTFENAKVGDRVWSFLYGWGEIVRVYVNGFFQIVVRFPVGGDINHSVSGALHKDACQTLFWDEIKFDAPTRPKRKVKKEVVRFLNVYKDGAETIWSSDYQAKHNTEEEMIAIAVELKGEYETEE